MKIRLASLVLASSLAFTSVASMAATSASEVEQTANSEQEAQPKAGSKAASFAKRHAGKIVLVTVVATVAGLGYYLGVEKIAMKVCPDLYLGNKFVKLSRANKKAISELAAAKLVAAKVLEPANLTATSTDDEKTAHETALKAFNDREALKATKNRARDALDTIKVTIKNLTDAPAAT